MINGDTNMDALMAMAEDCKGQRFPVVVEEDSALRLCRLAQDKIIPNQMAYQLYNPTVKFETIPYIVSGEAY